MTFTIFAGHHRARPWRFNFWWRKNSFSWVVKFTDSCRYDLGNVDQLDINKLVGIGYLPGHHTDSARFGWRYDNAVGKVEVLAYCYVNGKRGIQHICFCEIGKQYDLFLQVLTNCYYLSACEHGTPKVIGFAWANHYHNKKFKYRLGVFFGGNRAAPRTMKIELKKLG